MPELAVVMSVDVDHGLAELLGAVRVELAAQGVPTTQVTTFADPGLDRVWCAASPRELRGDGAVAPGDEILRRTIVLASDGMCAGDDDDPEELALLRRAGAVFALAPEAVSALERRGVSARLLRPGWSEPLDRYDPGAERSIDIMLSGGDTPRGAAWRTQAQPVLADRAIRVWPTPSASLSAAKLLVHVHRDPGALLGWRPALAAALSGAVLVTEHASDLAPFVPGEHLLVASAESLAFVAEAALEDPGRLSRIRHAAHERARSWLPLAPQVALLRAAVVELLAEPAPVSAP